jgi:hypothetical protein
MAEHMPLGVLHRKGIVCVIDHLIEQEQLHVGGRARVVADGDDRDFSTDHPLFILFEIVSLDIPVISAHSDKHIVLPKHDIILLDLLFLCCSI